jgi:hypothetical protein
MVKQKGSYEFSKVAENSGDFRLGPIYGGIIDVLLAQADQSPGDPVQYGLSTLQTE